MKYAVSKIGGCPFSFLAYYLLVKLDKSANLLLIVS